MIHTYTTVGPSKLDLLLADVHPQPLSDENNTKVIMIIDINRLTKLLSNTVMNPKQFYEAYESSIEMLSCIQHNLQVDYNTQQYRRTIQGADF